MGWQRHQPASFASRFRHITMPEPHHSIFYRLDTLPDAQQTVWKHWMHLGHHNRHLINSSSRMYFMTFVIVFVFLTNWSNLGSRCIPNSSSDLYVHKLRYISLRAGARAATLFPKSPVVDEESMKPGYWFSAFTQLVGWQEGHPAYKNPQATHPQRFYSGTTSGGRKQRGTS